MLQPLLKPLLRPLLYRTVSALAQSVLQVFALRQRDGQAIADRAGNIIQLRS